MSQLHGWPSLERDAKSFTICETFTSCFLPFLWEHKKSLQSVFLSDTSQGKKTGLPNLRKPGLHWINQIILLATVEVHTNLPPSFRYLLLFWALKESTGGCKGRGDAWHPMRSFKTQCCQREPEPAHSTACKLASPSEFQARLGLNCNLMEMWKVSKAVQIFLNMSFLFLSLLWSLFCIAASQPCIPDAFALTSTLSRLRVFCKVLGSEQSTMHEFRFAGSSDLRQHAQP